MAVASPEMETESLGAIAALVGEDDPVTRRVASVLSQHQYHLIFHNSPEDLLAELTDGPEREDAAMAPDVEARHTSVTGPTDAAPVLYVLYCRARPAHGNDYDVWLRTVRTLNSLTPGVSILFAVDDEKPRWLIRGALAAGADEILRTGDAEIEELVWTRVQSALARAEAAPVAVPAPEAAPVPGVERRMGERRRRDRRGAAQAAFPAAESADVTEAWEEPATEDEVRAARERVQAALDGLPTVEERRAPLADLLGVRAPALRAQSGRLDARKIAGQLGVSLASLAKLTPISRQALNETPDSPRAQAALDPLARILDVLDTVLPREHRGGWLNTPHPRLAGETPIHVILHGGGERVARMLEMARDGGVD